MDIGVEGRRSDAIGQTNYGLVCDAIRAEIVAGLHPPGARLKIQELMEQYRLSSNPIREALQQLQGEGLVVISPNKGATVRQIDETFLRHIYEIAEGLDCILAGRCAAMATPAQVARLRSIHEKIGEAADAGQSGRRLLLNGEFHEYIAEITGNMEAINIRRRHRNLVRTIRQQYGYEPERIRHVQQEHEAIVDAIAAGDVAGAERAARFHVVRSYEDIMLRFRSYLTQAKP
jgi:DNA-binding GntR family transcriptional regulator